MKKKILSLAIIMILLGILFILTGCGSSNNITKDLNDIVNEEVTSWKEKEYARTLSVVSIQNSIDSKKMQYAIVASGDKEFTSTPDFTEYKEDGISNYNGNTYSNMRMLEKDMNVNNIVVYDRTNKKYYNIKVTYEETDLNGSKKEYPVFSDAKELK